MRPRALAALAVAVPVVLLGAVAVTGLDRSEDRVGAAAGATAEVAAAGAVIRSKPTGGLAVGQTAPAFSVPTLSGGTFQMPSGAPTVLTFVNLCPTCIEDTRAIGALRERFPEVAVLAVASDPTADRAAVEEFMRQAGSPDFALALDPDSTLTQTFDAFSASVLVVDGAGRITYRGPVQEDAMVAALREAGAGE